MHQVIVGVAAVAANAALQNQAVQSTTPATSIVQPAPAAPIVQPTTAVPVVQTVPQTGKIVIYRGSSIMGMGIACPVRYKEQQLVELARGKFAEWVVPAGRYILTNHTSSVEVAVDPGETRYVRCMIKPGMLVGRADLQIVDAERFTAHRNEFEQKEITAPSTTGAPPPPAAVPPTANPAATPQ